MRDAMAPAMVREELSAEGRAAGAAPWRRRQRRRLRAAPSPASERRLPIGSELGSSRPPPRGSRSTEANQKRGDGERGREGRADWAKRPLVKGKEGG